MVFGKTSSPPWPLYHFSDHVLWCLITFVLQTCTVWTGSDLQNDVYYWPLVRIGRCLVFPVARTLTIGLPSIRYGRVKVVVKCNSRGYVQVCTTLNQVPYQISFTSLMLLLRLPSVVTTTTFVPSHRCNNKTNCIRPSHIKAESQKINVRRGLNLVSTNAGPLEADLEADDAAVWGCPFPFPVGYDQEIIAQIIEMCNAEAFDVVVPVVQEDEDYSGDFDFGNMGRGRSGYWEDDMDTVVGVHIVPESEEEGEEEEVDDDEEEEQQQQQSSSSSSSSSSRSSSSSSSSSRVTRSSSRRVVVEEEEKESEEESDDNGSEDEDDERFGSSGEEESEEESEEVSEEDEGDRDARGVPVEQDDEGDGAVGSTPAAGTHPVA
jgi:hypothetical protein